MTVKEESPIPLRSWTIRPSAFHTVTYHGSSQGSKNWENRWESSLTTRKPKFSHPRAILHPWKTSALTTKHTSKKHYHSSRPQTRQAQKSPVESDSSDNQSDQAHSPKNTLRDKLENNLNKLHQLDNLQTRNALFKFSMVASLLHLLPSDFTLAHPKTNPRSTLWKSPTTDKTEEIIKHFLAKISGIPEDNVPAPSALISSLPQRLGGLGYQYATAAAYPRLMTQIARAISMAGSTETPIPEVHRQLFQNWEENPSPELTNFQKALSLFANELAEEALYVPSRYDTETHNRLMNHTLREHVVPRIFTDTPPEQRIFLPSVLSPLTSMAFTLPLTASQFCIENSVFKTALKRKLRLPLFIPQQHQHIPLRCRCSSNKRLDPTGDHLYSCSAASKTPLSNAIRDTLFDVLKQVAPAARTVESVHDVHVEPPGLAPGHHRNIRPADVGLLLRQPHKNRHFQYLALDITIPPPQQPQAILDPSDHEKIAESASRTHQEAARDKFCRDPTTAQHLLQNGVYLLP